MNIANQLTMLRILCIPIFIVVMLVSSNYEIATIIFVLASLTDWLDGFLARRYQLITTFGKFADPMADKLLVITALIMLIEYRHIPSWTVAVIMCRELAITGLRLLLAQESQTVLAADWAGKVKTFTQMFAIIFLLMNDFHLTIPVGYTLLYISVVLTIYSGVEYFYKNRFIFKNL